MEDESDAWIIAASGAEPRLFAIIFDRHYDTVSRYLTRRAGVDQAEDLASETFTAAFDARHRYDPGHASARPWLLGIATNLLRHHARAEARRLRAYARLDDRGAVDDGLSQVDTRLDAGRAWPAVARALADLNRGDRDALLLLAWADLHYDEIAVALRIPIGTVRSRIHRARQRLRERLGESGQYQGTDIIVDGVQSNG